MTGYKIAIRNDNENVLSLIMLTKQESNSLQVIGSGYLLRNRKECFYQ